MLTASAPSPAPAIVLASASAIRRQLLAGAGLSFQVVPAQVDEAALRTALEHGSPPATPAEVAGALAEAKARAVSARHPAALVIGADQVLDLAGEVLAKSADRAAARATLLRLRGQSHSLHSGVAVARAGAILWSQTPSARLRVRDFSEAFLESYLAAAGPALTDSVGAYQLEGLGIQLFEAIEGDYFTILGLPLLPLLACLRQHGALVP